MAPVGNKSLHRLKHSHWTPPSLLTASYSCYRHIDLRKHIADRSIIIIIIISIGRLMTARPLRQPMMYRQNIASLKFPDHRQLHWLPGNVVFSAKLAKTVIFKTSPLLRYCSQSELNTNCESTGTIYSPWESPFSICVLIFAWGAFKLIWTNNLTWHVFSCLAGTLPFDFLLMIPS